jgi:hypothetical protein
MTPEQEAILERLRQVLDPETFERIKLILAGLWAGNYAAAGWGEAVAKILLEWAATQGTWMWLTIRQALGLSETTAAVATAATGETAAVAGLAALPALSLLLGGLLLPATKMWGRPRWYWPWEDPCDDDFKELGTEFIEFYEDARSFSAAPTRSGAMKTLGQASFMIKVCEKFLRECPKNKYAEHIKKVLAAAEQTRDQCLDYLSTH